MRGTLPAWRHWQMQVNARCAERCLSYQPRFTADLTTKASEVATEIAEWVCKEALVHDGLWNWMGSDVTVADDSSELMQLPCARSIALPMAPRDGVVPRRGVRATGRSDSQMGREWALRHASHNWTRYPDTTEEAFTPAFRCGWVASRRVGSRRPRTA